MPRNAREDKRNQDVSFQYTHHNPSTVFPSPPAHLPTPLPESTTPEERLQVLAPEPLVASTALDHLIDFQQPQEEAVQFSYPLDFYDDEVDLSVHYRSPAFIEAQLPSGEHLRSETPPLPIPPRIDPNYREDEREKVPNMTSAGHVRSPTLPRSPGRFESISRTIKTYAPPASTIKSSATAVLKSSADTIRTYVPSSVHIPIPSGSPSPPLVTRPLSFGQFSVDSDLSRQPFSPHQASNALDSLVNQHETYRPSGVSRVLTNDNLVAYPNARDTRVDTITWAHWDTLLRRCTLIIGYTTGIQVWDCHDLGSVTEVLNLRLSSEDWTLDFMDRRISFKNFVHAAILPSPSINANDGDGDPLSAHRPLLGILMTSDDSHSAFFVYSFSSHQIIKRLPLPGITLNFLSNNHFIVISTVLPVALHLLSPATFHTIWTISSEMLSPFSRSPNLSSNVTIGLPIDNAQSSETPRPVFALSYRLLAYASPHPNQPFRLSTSSTIPSNSVPNHSSAPFRLPTDFGQAAIKLGGTVLGGMKVLGGLAFEAAKGQVADGATNRRGGGNPRFFSRSAPANERPLSFSPGDTEKEKIIVSDTNPAVETGSYVTILDLTPLLDGTGTQPAKVAEFRASRTQAIIQLRFTEDGCRLIVVPENGQVIRMYALCPTPSVNRSWLKSADSKHKLDQVSRIYDLRRGRTSVFVDEVAYSQDGRWLVIGTQNRTLHVFATNPYGGNPNIPSHLEGRVKNNIELVSGQVEITPLVRLRSMQHPKHVQFKVPLAFTFIRSGDVHLPSSLLPPIPSSFKHDSASPPPISPRHAFRGATFQDILLFDPIDGMLSLRRILVEQKPEGQISLPVLSSSLSKPSPGGISRSLPGGVGGSARSSTSPSAGSSISRTSSNSTGVSGLNTGADVPMELVGKETVVATWGLQRTTDWEEIRERIPCPNEPKHFRSKSRTNWLAEAELSPCSRSPRILPRSIYLSHQFGFWTLGEDYHALLRQFRFDFHGNKVQVRKEVQISLGIGSNHTNDRFVDDFNSLDGFCSSFDEPLADALANDLSNYAHAIPPILPMYPNGISGAHSVVSKPSAFIRNTIPIKRFGDGVSEGLGRIRKEISYSYSNRRMYSPSLGPKSDADGGNVPLEFDEEEEDYLGVTRGRAIGMSEGSVESGPTIPTPASERDEPWRGWESRDIRMTVEEMERFDDISVVGFLDEEHQQELDARRRAVMIKNQRDEGKQSYYFGM